MGHLNPSPSFASGTPLHLASYRIFTTGHIAKICKVAPRTVSKWCNRGIIESYRLPGSDDRRVSREALVKFCLNWNIRFALEFLNGNSSVYISYATDDNHLLDYLDCHHKEQFGTRYDATAAAHLGQLVSTYNAYAVIIDTSCGRETTTQTVAWLHRSHPEIHVIIIIYSGCDGDLVDSLVKFNCSVIQHPLPCDYSPTHPLVVELARAKSGYLSYLNRSKATNHTPHHA